MLSKNRPFSNFSNSIHSHSDCLRPDNEQLIALLLTQTNSQNILARGNGSSYGDCCINDKGIIIDTTRLNHLLAFNPENGLLVCQGGVRFADLFSVHPDYIPPVIPGTLQATIAGGIANDIHGKNNRHAGSFGQHLKWLELQQSEQSIFCSPTENRELFYATIAGLGLTGLIKRAAFTMQKASHFVKVQREKYQEFDSLMQAMCQKSGQYAYQVAWLDLLNKPAAILSLANYSPHSKAASPSQFTIPKLPFRCISPWLMKQFNRYYYRKMQLDEQILPLIHFNNPLDSISHWNRLYGKKGFLQFQAAFEEETALHELLKLIRSHQASPTLAVLKYFTQEGPGLLSFTKPGYTLAVDFINNKEARAAILKMNDFITQIKGRVYLAKDFLLSKRQFLQQYPKHPEFLNLLAHYHNPMSSDLGRRLGLSR